jgi:hypothetical protein
MTGEADVDRTSERGLAGLSQFLTFRTSLEPGTPTGVDIETDPLAFYPLIYWPISASAPMPSAQAIGRIDAYMKNGGTVLFDTRDQFADLGSGTSPENQRLRAILSGLDIPALEPVPEDHVIAKAFYLLEEFPGRYSGSAMWVEALAEGGAGRSAVSADGVTSIIITGNDLAGACRRPEPSAAVSHGSRRPDAARICLPYRREHHDVHADRQLQDRPGPRASLARTVGAIAP